MFAAVGVAPVYTIGEDGNDEGSADKGVPSSSETMTAGWGAPRPQTGKTGDEEGMGSAGEGEAPESDDETLPAEPSETATDDMRDE